MNIYVLSASRADAKLPTLYSLLNSNRADDVRLVVQKSQAEEYATRHPEATLTILPAGIDRISPTRQWVVENCDSEKLVLFDDDLVFAGLGEDGKTFKGEHVVDGMLDMLDIALSTNMHATVAPRNGCNRLKPDEDGFMYVGRSMRVLGYRREAFDRLGVRFDRIETKEDFDVTLQLLRLGYANAIVCKFINGQGKSNAPGGCSVFRTKEMEERSSNALSVLHEPFVKVVERSTKDGWFDGGKRVDVRVSWKKAYKEGLAKKSMMDSSSKMVGLKQRYLPKVPISELSEHPKNPRKRNAIAMSSLAQSIETTGWYGAVVVDSSTGYVLAGNHRLRAAKSSGAETLPVIYLDELSPGLAERIMLADNKQAELSGVGYDETKLRELLTEVSLSDFGIEGTGWKPSDITLKPKIEIEEVKISAMTLYFSSHEKHQSALKCIRSIAAGLGSSDDADIVLMALEEMSRNERSDSR